MTDNNNNNTMSETTTTDAATAAKEQIENADGQEMTTFISNLIHVINSKPGSDPANTAEIIHYLLDLAGDIQLEKRGLITQAESLRLASEKYKEGLISLATTIELARDQPRIAARLIRLAAEKKNKKEDCTLEDVVDAFAFSEDEIKEDNRR